MTDWDAVSAIGTCIGAFGTFLACSISLWQSHIANVNRLNNLILANISESIRRKSIRLYTLMSPVKLG